MHLGKRFSLSSSAGAAATRPAKSKGRVRENMMVELAYVKRSTPKTVARDAVYESLLLYSVQTHVNDLLAVGDV